MQIANGQVSTGRDVRIRTHTAARYCPHDPIADDTDPRRVVASTGYYQQQGSAKTIHTDDCIPNKIVPRMQIGRWSSFQEDYVSLKKDDSNGIHKFFRGEEILEIVILLIPGYSAKCRNCCCTLPWWLSM
jgi:hypothetical protein